MTTKPQINVELLLIQLHTNLVLHLAQHKIENFCLIGIRSGGVWIANALKDRLEHPHLVAEIDISFHRDDLGQRGLDPSVRPSQMPWNLDGKHVILIDDVLFTGRTIRAAINEIYDWGRPASITLAVLAVRNGRELPIQADAVGGEFVLTENQTLKLCGPTPLFLEMIDIQRGQA